VLQKGLHRGTAWSLVYNMSGNGGMPARRVIILCDPRAKLMCSHMESKRPMADILGPTSVHVSILMRHVHLTCKGSWDTAASERLLCFHMVFDFILVITVKSVFG